MNKKFFAGVAAGLFVSGIGSIAVADFYDFESATPAAITGGTRQATQNYSTIGFGSYFQHSSSIGEVITLTLSGLAPHTTVILDFDVAFINSWDGEDPTYGPDYFNVTVDGTSLYSDPITQDWGGSDLWVDNLNESYPDSAIPFGPLSLAHTADTISVSWFASGIGYQGFDDESFAIDNISLTVQGGAPVPEPSTVLLFGTGLAAVAGFRFRKRNNNSR